jgi:hypothetical protein
MIPTVNMIPAGFIQKNITKKHIMRQAGYHLTTTDSKINKQLFLMTN